MTTSAYEKQKAASRARIQKLAQEGRDIGGIPKVKNPRRRNSTRADLKRFILTYLKESFTDADTGEHLPFCEDQLRVMEKLRRTVLEGGLFAMAMPRGSGKTSLCEATALWAVLHGHRRFVVLIGSDADAATEMLDSIKVELGGNELLLADFPEACFPIAALENISHRCRGQTANGGEPTKIQWLDDRVVLPTVKKGKTSGSIIRVTGLLGRVRGMKHKREDGTSIRPDLCIPDDPQTDESSRSLSQCEYRERILTGAVLGLAGPRKKIACLMPCTVIQPGDLSDRFLDPEIHPEWHGERTKMLYGEPVNQPLWDQYAEIRKEEGQQVANGFYETNRAALEAGLRAAWPERYEPGELSAIQSAMNIKIDKPAVFAAEYQNEPLPLATDGHGALTVEGVLERLNRHGRHAVPTGAARLTAAIDVQADLLYYAVCAWKEDFTGHVIDYGTFPEQPRAYFTLKEANPTLSSAVGISSPEGAIRAALDRLGESVLARAYAIDQGGTLRIERCLVDANWGQSTDVVYNWCRQTPHAAVVMPAHGKGITASGKAMDEWSKQPGERKGEGWVVRWKSGRPVKHAVIDANYWKSFLSARLQQAAGERGAMMLWGNARSAHRLLADHLTSEYPHRTKSKLTGREVDEWAMRPGCSDNHWLDALASCCAAAAIQGCKLPGMDAKPQARKRKVSWADFQKSRKAGR